MLGAIQIVCGRRELGALVSQWSRVVLEAERDKVFIGVYDLESSDYRSTDGFNIRGLAVDSQVRGFGQNHNELFKSRAKNENFFLIANPDIQLLRSDLVEMFSTMKTVSGAALVDFRQRPFAHPKSAGKNLAETPWCSGALMMISTEFFRESEGFDENIYMYCDDVELSWRAWKMGWSCLTQNDVSFLHLTRGPIEGDYLSLERLESLRSHLYLALKHFGPLRLDKEHESAIRLFPHLRKALDGRRKSLLSGEIVFDKQFTSQSHDWVRIMAPNLYHFGGRT